MFGFTKRPLFLIAWKNLRTYPVRIFLTTSSIILGVAVIIASNIFSESNKSAFDNLFTGIYEGVDLVVQPIPEDFANWFETNNSVDLRSLLRDIEIVFIEAALNRNNGNTSEAAKDLKLLRTTLIEKVKKYGL